MKTFFATLLVLGFASVSFGQHHNYNHNYQHNNYVYRPNHIPAHSYIFYPTPYYAPIYQRYYPNGIYNPYNPSVYNPFYNNYNQFYNPYCQPYQR